MAGCHGYDTYHPRPIVLGPKTNEVMIKVVFVAFILRSVPTLVLASGCHGS